MNDRYLYRAKHIHILPCNEHLDGTWVIGYLSGEHYISNEDGDHLIDPETICQCTGLKDKNGKLIWENDVVRCGKNCTVTWCDTFASWRLNTSGWMYSHFFGEACEPEDVEVIGNIFDNLELLE